MEARACEICGNPSTIRVTQPTSDPIDHYFCKAHEPVEMQQLRAKGYRFGRIKEQVAELLRQWGEIRKKYPKSGGDK